VCIARRYFTVPASTSQISLLMSIPGRYDRALFWFRREFNAVKG
jgi:hypothetical protein